MKTPISTQIAEHVNKVVMQFNEGVITANELCCNLHNVLTQKVDDIIYEYELEQKEIEQYWENK